MPVFVPAPPRPPSRPVGDPGVARGWAGALRRSGSLLDDRCDWVGNEAIAMVGAEDGWSGPAADAYAARVAYTGQDLGTTAVVLRTLATAVDAYADDIQSTQRRADDLADAYRVLTSARADLVADAAHVDATTNPRIVADLGGGPATWAVTSPCTTSRPRRSRTPPCRPRPP